MKIKGYKNYINEGRYGRDEYGHEDDNMNDVEYLCYLLRQMFNNSGIKGVDVSNQKLDITINIPMAPTETMSNIMKVLDVAKKLRKDILAQYEDNLSIWKGRYGTSIILEFFYVDDGFGNSYENDDYNPDDYNGYGDDDVFL